jgi:hypothetical protein
LIATGLVGQRVFVIVLGYEDLNDHNELHHDPMMAVTAKLEARRKRAASIGSEVAARDQLRCGRG